MEKLFEEVYKKSLKENKYPDRPTGYYFEPYLCYVCDEPVLDKKDSVEWDTFDGGSEGAHRECAKKYFGAIADDDLDEKLSEYAEYL